MKILTDIRPCSDSHLLVIPVCVAMVLDKCHGPLRLSERCQAWGLLKVADLVIKPRLFGGDYFTVTTGHGAFKIRY